ncbi:MAG TPA: ABC transporter ATP-binding protein [Solirubrobacteraceae bacterium]|jgi:ABC-2 type transport system ATP-binding protein|nr:ABC transporter ATP-binding protein [Solirubrobacteraceae bacterium]
MHGATQEAVAGPVLSVRSLVKQYGARTALSDVSFDVARGELVAVVGPNGAGKTTLLSIIAGAQRPSAGSVGGSAVAAGTSQVGWAPQQAALYSKLTVRENLQLFARLEGVADAPAAVTRMLEQTGLAERADERVQRLSGGNRQRVNVALGLLADPQMLALDEPSSALDPGQRARLWQFVGGLAARGTSVLFSTHHLGEVRRYASRAIVLAEGEVLFDGAPAALLGAGDGDDLEAAFLRLLQERGRA